MDLGGLVDLWLEGIGGDGDDGIIVVFVLLVCWFF